MFQKSAALPRTAGPTSGRSSIWRLFFLIITVAILIGYVQPVKDYLVKTGQITEEQSATDSLREKHDSLQVEKDQLLKNNYIEQVARRDLGLVKPGEQPFVVKDLNKDEGQTGSQTTAREKEKSITERVKDTLGSFLP